MKNRSIIAVIGDAGIKENSRQFKLAETLGHALVDAGYRVLCGGLGGIMKAVCKGARCSIKYRDGDIIGILPGYDPTEANDCVDIKIATGLDEARNIIVANSDAIIAIGGGAGTLSEIAFAWMLKRLIIAYKVEGWSGRLANMRLDHRIRYENIKEDKIYAARTEKEAIRILNRYLDLYTKRHGGIKQKKLL